MTKCCDLLKLEQCCFLDDPGGGAFAFCFGPTLGRLTDLFIPHPGKFPFTRKNADAQRLAGGLGGGGWALLELTVVLARQIKGVLPSSKAILHVGAIN